MRTELLIVVDYQNDFVTGKLPVPMATKIAPIIQNEINNNKYDVIAYTFDTHTKKDYVTSEEAKLFPDIHCEFKTSGWNFFHIKPRFNKEFETHLKNLNEPRDFQVHNEFFFMKDKFSIWEGNQNFEPFMKKFNPKDTNITVVGVATNYCVFMNVIGLLERGYNVTINQKAVMGITHLPTGEIDVSYAENVEVMNNAGVVWKIQ